MPTPKKSSIFGRFHDKVFGQKSPKKQMTEEEASAEREKVVRALVVRMQEHKIAVAQGKPSPLSIPSKGSKPNRRDGFQVQPANRLDFQVKARFSSEIEKARFSSEIESSSSSSPASSAAHSPLAAMATETLARNSTKIKRASIHPVERQLNAKSLEALSKHIVAARSDSVQSTDVSDAAVSEASPAKSLIKQKRGSYLTKRKTVQFKRKSILEEIHQYQIGQSIKASARSAKNRKASVHSIVFSEEWLKQAQSGETPVKQKRKSTKNRKASVHQSVHEVLLSEEFLKKHAQTCEF